MWRREPHTALKSWVCLSWRLRESGRDWSESSRVRRGETEQTTGSFSSSSSAECLLDVPDNHGVIRRVPLPAVQALEQYNWLTFAFLILETRASPARCHLSEILLISTVREINLVPHGVGIELSGARRSLPSACLVFSSAVWVTQSPLAWDCPCSAPEGGPAFI